MRPPLSLGGAGAANAGADAKPGTARPPMRYAPPPSSRRREIAYALMNPCPTQSAIGLIMPSKDGRLASPQPRGALVSRRARWYPLSTTWRIVSEERHASAYHRYFRRPERRDS